MREFCFFLGLSDDDIAAILKESDEEYLDDDTLDLSFLPDDVEQSDDNMDDEVETVDVEPMPQPSTSAAPTTKRRKTQKTQSLWHVNDDCDLNFSGRDAEDSPSGASTPLEFVEMFWPAEIFEILARETNIRHMAETGRKLNCSATEMKKFLGISLLMGCIKYPRIKIYWRQGFRIHLISDNMSRNRYFLLRSFLRARAGIDMPEEEKKADRLWRVRPIMESFVCECVYLSSFLGWRYGMNGNSGSCRQPN